MTAEAGRRSLGPTELKRLHRAWRRRTEHRLALLLDGVMTPYNVGSIVRLAAAYGVTTAWLAGATVPATHPGARKTALGTDRFVDLREGGTALEAAAAAKEEGFRLVGVELTAAARPLYEVDLAGDVCLAFGHEDHGLSAACLGACDAVAFLPLVGRVGSLNVASAAGIALYEARRQEWAQGEWAQGEWAPSDPLGVDVDP
jgi:tRNA (guanosine-2'-O-)-methyltransferase